MTVLRPLAPVAVVRYLSAHVTHAGLWARVCGCGDRSVINLVLGYGTAGPFNAIRGSLQWFRHLQEAAPANRTTSSAVAAGCRPSALLCAARVTCIHAVGSRPRWRDMTWLPRRAVPIQHNPEHDLGQVGLTEGPLSVQSETLCLLRGWTLSTSSSSSCRDAGNGTSAAPSSLNSWSSPAPLSGPTSTGWCRVCSTTSSPTAAGTCESENGATVSSFDSTICVLEGLLESELGTCRGDRVSPPR